MFENCSRITVIAGHYGSGKTEFAVNLAYSESKRQEKTLLLDLDIVNPYFCSREQEEQLARESIELIAPSPQCRLSDVPALPAEVAKIFSSGSGRAIIDVGGDKAGAKVLSRYMPQLSACGYDLWMVLNANRPQTADLDKALYFISAIEEASRLKVSGIVNNTHLCSLTSVDDIRRGSELARRVCQSSGLPLICSTAPEWVIGQLSEGELEEPVFPITVRMKKPWEF